MISRSRMAVFSGRPRLYSVKAGLNPVHMANRVLVGEGTNMVCVGMHDAVQRLLMRDFEQWQPTSISVGFGGEYEQDGTYTALRQPPAYADDAMRKVIMSTPIVQITQSPMTEERRIIYSAILAPTDGVTDTNNPARPFIDELGITAANGALLAHYVSDAESSGRTIKHAKTNLEWLVIDWEIQFIATPETAP